MSEFKWINSQEDCPRKPGARVIVRTKDNDIRIMNLKFEEKDHEPSFVGMFFNHDRNGYRSMYWQCVHTDYTCKYNHVSEWSYVSGPDNKQNKIGCGK